MAKVIAFESGGFRYVEGVFQYSAGVATQPGFAIERARLARPLPLAAGFALVESHLTAIGRPHQAFCACELRSPEPFSDQGFGDFNRRYVETLERWGLYRNGVNPVARTNVCPVYDSPEEPSLYAFSYTVPSDTNHRGFIIAGGGEAPEGAGNYQDVIVRRGDTSLDGLREKVRFVMATMESRLVDLGIGWRDALSTQAYTVHDIGPLVAEEIVAKGATIGGLEWHFCRPPVVNIEFEMDVRAPSTELILR